MRRSKPPCTTLQSPCTHALVHVCLQVPAIVLAAQAHLHLANKDSAAAAEMVSFADGHRGNAATGGAIGDVNTSKCSGRGDSDHRELARQLLHRLSEPPFEPPRTRIHRVRAYERREIAETLRRALD